MINGIDKDLLADVIKLLRPLKDFILTLEKTNSPTIHLVFNEIYKLKNFFENEDVADCKDIQELKKAILFEIEDKMEINELHVVAAAFDPRQKDRLNLVGLSDLEIVSLKANIAKLALQTKNNQIDLEISDIPPAEKKVKITDISAPISSNTSFDASVKREIDSYFIMQLAKDDLDFSILDWWKNNKYNFPILSKVVRTVLSIPASSAKAEADFSAAGFIKNPRRANLAPEILDDMLVAKSNVDLIK
jgi:hypothetical protein